MTKSNNKKNQTLEGISILIPCLNEKDTIGRVINEAHIAAQKYITRKHEILVADNGSTDGSLSIVSKSKLTRLIRIPVHGYGACLHYGILSARYKYVIFADADLSYSFDEIDKFLKAINLGYDLVLGSRFKGRIAKGAMPSLHRYLGTPLLTNLIKFIYGIKVSDCNSGMRAVKKSFYKKLIMKNSGMEWASELLIKTALNRGRYTEVPITFQKDKRLRRPHLRMWEDGWRHLKVIILMKPESLLVFALAVILVGFISVRNSLFTFIAMILFAEFLSLSYLAAKKLSAVIDRTSNKISSLIDRLPLVPIAVILTIIGVLNLFLISDKHLFTKYILLVQIILYDLWLFFIETIKTHLVNPLTDNINAIN